MYQFETVYEPKYPSVGCFKDSIGSRVLSGIFVKNEPTMTTEVRVPETTYRGRGIGGGG